jgi:GlpG protein
MRLIYTTQDQKQALLFSTFLKGEGIDNQCDIQPNTDWGSSDYGTIKCQLWIIDEDQVDTAKRWLDEFEKNPDNPVFKGEQKKNPLPLFDAAKEGTPPLPNNTLFPKNSKNERGLGIITLYLLIACSVLFIYSQITFIPYNSIPSFLPPSPVFTPPIDKKLMYDYPKAYEIIDKLVSAYGIENMQQLSDLPPEGQVLLYKYAETPYWEGLYDLLVLKAKEPAKPWDFTAPMFEKIQQGEIWRLATPVLLHLNMFHLFFNMIWLIVLGKMIEDRVAPLKYILLILIVAIASNTAQYLMTGPNFIGFSGVICGMLGFIWARQQRSPWEGYHLTAGVVSFMLFFVLIMAASQFVSFLLEIFYDKTFIPIIANTAHIVGGVVGYALGCLNFFSLKKT